MFSCNRWLRGGLDAFRLVLRRPLWRTLRYRHPLGVVVVLSPEVVVTALEAVYQCHLRLTRLALVENVAVGVAVLEPLPLRLEVVAEELPWTLELRLSVLPRLVRSFQLLRTLQR